MVCAMIAFSLQIPELFPQVHTFYNDVYEYSSSFLSSLNMMYEIVSRHFHSVMAKVLCRCWKRTPGWTKSSHLCGMKNNISLCGLLCVIGHKLKALPVWRAVLIWIGW